MLNSRCPMRWSDIWCWRSQHLNCCSVLFDCSMFSVLLCVYASHDWMVRPNQSFISCFHNSCIIYIYTYIYNPPCNLGGGRWDPWFCRGPQRQAPKNSLLNQSLLSRVGSYLLQNQEPSTAKISDTENSCFLQNQERHMWKHQNKSKNITCWVKTSKDDSVEICVRVDSVEMFCWSLIL